MVFIVTFCQVAKIIIPSHIYNIPVSENLSKGYMPPQAIPKIITIPLTTIKLQQAIHICKNHFSTYRLVDKIVVFGGIRFFF
ncbi:hypothetical protein M23134_07272 [Microscilla marina ATCC 23134]|uniref:Uncharacterized protein n=1 Tax=Microscilla marina ATCC 23134 TaxID=313606 RepID=A1ZVC3_MICM2|nr:hypothetical protein M23134_07272 [Microscilla marina ATCC 23134]